MSILTLAEIVFFLAYGISYFMPFKYAKEICAVAAIAIGIALIVHF